jgi:hypothetical protein
MVSLYLATFYGLVAVNHWFLFSLWLGHCAP